MEFSNVLWPHNVRPRNVGEKWLLSNSHAPFTHLVIMGVNKILLEVDWTQLNRLGSTALFGCQSRRVNAVFFFVMIMMMMMIVIMIMMMADSSQTRI